MVKKATFFVVHLRPNKFQKKFKNLTEINF